GAGRGQTMPANSPFSPKRLLAEMPVSWGRWGRAPASGKGFTQDGPRKNACDSLLFSKWFLSSNFHHVFTLPFSFPGSEANFSFSSNTGSISVPEIHMSAAGSKRSSFSHKIMDPCPTSPEPVHLLPVKRALCQHCKNHLDPANICQRYRASSAGSSNSGSHEATAGRYISCGGHHSIMSANHKQYLSPLQQKEVTVQHLKAKLKESESKLRERYISLQKSELERVIPEHLGGELAFLEARREIKELKQVIESMKNSLAKKDKKIQKYFIDISTEKKKPEALLQSMEVAWSGSVRDEQSLEHTCDSEGKPSALCPELSDPAPSSSAVNQEMLENVLGENLTSSWQGEKISNVMVEQATQTDIGPYSLDVEWLIQNIFRAPDACPLSPPSSLKELGEFSLGSFSDSGIIVDLTPSDPNSALLLSPVESPCRTVKHGIKESHFVKELDFAEPHDAEAFGYVSTVSQTEIKRRYWGSSLSSRRPSGCSSPCCTNYCVGFQYSGGTNPIYNIRARLCGCCLVALHSLCHTPFSIKT
uniref:Uncharacterized protein n=1 Tax=Bubo bubo TaxID=30461 RepID=A0A8C0EUT0_BUBBB